MASPLIKPQSDSGPLVILGPWANVAIMDAQSGQIIEQSRNTGASNGRANTLRFSQPGNAYNNVVLVNTDTGQPISDTISLANRATGSGNTFSGSAYTPDPGGHGDLSGASGSGAGGGVGTQRTYDENGNLVAGPIAANLGAFSYNPMTFNTVEPSTIEPVDPVDIFAVADKAGARNKEAILDSFAAARDVSREMIDSADDANMERLTGVNDYNAAAQAEAFASLGPDAANALDQGTKNLSAFSEGRLPDALENEILNQSTRAAQAQQSNITGGGISSSFGQRVASQLSIQQRLGLQTSAINSAPSFLANALELRRGSPQKLAFDPNQEINTQTSIAGSIASGSTLSPGSAVNAEFTNTSNELSTRTNNANITNSASQYNSSGAATASQYNATALTSLQDKLVEYDLFNQREQQNYEQDLINASTQANADADTLGQSSDNADANIASNESAAENNAIEDVAGVTGTVAGIVDDVDTIVDTVSGGSSDADEETADDVDTSGTTNVTVTPSTSTPSTTVTDSGGSDILTPPDDRGEPIGSFEAEDGSQEVIFEDGSHGVDYNAEIDNYDADMSVESASMLNSRSLSMSPSNYAKAISTPTSVNTNQVDAHKAARRNAPVMAPEGSLDKAQVEYEDGTVGYDPTKSNSTLKKVAGPVPSAIYTDISHDRGDITVQNIKGLIKAMDTPGKVAKPTRGSAVFDPAQMSEAAKEALYPVVAGPDTSMSELGEDTFDTIYDQLATIPIVNSVPTTQKGKLITDDRYYIAQALNDLTRE